MNQIICNVSTGTITEVPFTDQEVADIEAVKASPEHQDWVATQYQRSRASEYPPVTDYLDGIVKGDQAQVQAYIDACLAVKAKYPKPGQTT